MNIDDFKKQFANAKQGMTQSEAACYIRGLLQTEYPMLSKTWMINQGEYIRRLCQRTACVEIIDELEKAAPWEDYREVIARLEWPYLQRVANHSFEDIYDNDYGNEWGKADAWFMEMLLSYNDVYLRMPGKVPDETPWRIYNTLISQIFSKLKKYRRNI